MPTKRPDVTADKPVVKADSWDIRVQYDYRFGSLALQASHGDSYSPVYQLPLSTVLQNLDPAVLKPYLDKQYNTTEPVTEGIDTARVRMLEETDWAGKVVLDIGGYDGFAAKIALDKGAKRAICLDNHQYEHYGWEEKKKEGVEYVAGDVMDWSGNGHFVFRDRDVLIDTLPDVIINYNVLYHVKDPWAFLAKCRELINPDGEMLLCTLFRYQDGAWMYLYEPGECNPTDESVFWGPSLEALERLLKFTGWQADKYALAYDRVLYRCKPSLEPQYRQSRY